MDHLYHSYVTTSRPTSFMRLSRFKQDLVEWIPRWLFTQIFGTAVRSRWYICKYSLISKCHNISIVYIYIYIYVSVCSCRYIYIYTYQINSTSSQVWGSICMDIGCNTTLQSSNFQVVLKLRAEWYLKHPTWCKGCWSWRLTHTYFFQSTLSPIP